MHSKRKHSPERSNSNKRRQTVICASGSGSDNDSSPSLPNGEEVVLLVDKQARTCIERTKRFAAWQKSIDRDKGWHLFGLPENMLHAVFGYLSFEDFLAVMSIDRRSRLVLYHMPEWSKILQLLQDAGQIYNRVAKIGKPPSTDIASSFALSRHIFTYDIGDLCERACTLEEFTTLVTYTHLACDVTRQFPTRDSLPFLIADGIKKIDEVARQINEVRRLSLGGFVSNAKSMLLFIMQNIYPMRFLCSLVYCMKFQSRSFLEDVIGNRHLLGLSYPVPREDLSVQDGCTVSFGEYHISKTICCTPNASTNFYMHAPIAVARLAWDARNQVAVYGAIYYKGAAFVGLDGSSAKFFSYFNPEVILDKAMCKRCHKKILELQKIVTRLSTSTTSQIDRGKNQRQPHFILEHGMRYLDRVCEEQTFQMGSWLMIPSEDSIRMLGVVSGSLTPVSMPALTGIYIYQNRRGIAASLSYSSAVVSPSILKPLISSAYLRL